MSWEQDRRWVSGAAVALVAGITGLAAHVVLRASSVDAPGWPALLAGGVLLTLALWPLASRSTSIPMLALVLAVTQFGTQALALAAAGQAGADPRSLVCCPSTAQVRPGVLGALAAEAGWWLALVQLMACYLLAVAIRGGRAAADLLVATARLVRSVVETASIRLISLLTLVLRLTPALGVTSPATPRPTPSRVLTRGRLLAGTTTRRGPPARRITSPVPSRARLAPLALPAAG